jgi:integrase
MVRVKVKYIKCNPSGWYWRPTPKVAALGFSPEPLGKDKGKAILRAQALNEQVREAATGHKKSKQIRPGTVNELLHLYRRDEAYLNLKSSTRTTYERHLTAIEKWAGDLLVTSIKRKAVKKWYRKMREKTPAQASARIRVLRVLMAFAVDEDYRPDNPATKMRLYTAGGNTRSWTNREVKEFCNAAIRHGRPSVAAAIMIAYTIGQRLGDILKMTWSQYDGTAITLTQSKTGKSLRIPLLASTINLLNNAPRTSPLIIISEATGKMYNPDHFSHTFARIRNDAGLDRSLKFMALRHTAAQQLGDAGCSEDQIRSITGHKSRQIVSTYVKPSEELSSSAMRKLAHFRGEK